MACQDLAIRCGVKMSFEAYDVPEADVVGNAEKIAYLAYEDQCSPCNPRTPIVSDMVHIIKQAYYGNQEGTPNKKK